MSSQFKHLAACLPITALHVLRVGDARLVLYGSGPYVHLTDDATGGLQSRVQVFERNTVHGIQLAKSKLFENGGYSATLIAWGGQSLRVLRVRAREPYSSGFISLDTVCAEYCAPDWIFDVAFLDDDEDIERSAFYCRACLITAHNALFGLEFGEVAALKPTEIRVQEITTGLKSVLYSANLAWLSPTQILVAAGTTFGEIVVWSCTFSANARSKPSLEHSVRIHHAFTGHEGSIFGVQISPEIRHTSTNRRRLLASCSDDRTIRIWDVSDCGTNTGNPETNHYMNERPTRSTGFGDVTLKELDMSAENCIAKAWGHASRIWAVNFLDASVDATGTSVRLVSRGEDATCQLWELDLPHLSAVNGDSPSLPNATLTHKTTYNYHSGKNVWSTGFSASATSPIIYSGGADGNLVCFGVDKHAHASDKDIHLKLHLFRDSDPDMMDMDMPSAITGKAGEKVLRFAIVSDNCFIAISSLGRVVCGHVSQESGGPNGPPVTWLPIGTVEAFKSYVVLSGLPDRGAAIIGDGSGGLWLYSHDTKSIEFLTSTEKKMSSIINLRSFPLWDDPSDDPPPLAFITISMDALNEVSLFIEQTTRAKTFRKRTFRLHEGFVVTSALFIRQNSYLVLGSRTGYIALVNVEKSMIIPGVAEVFYSKLSNDAITSIASVSQPNDEMANEETILTTERDGNYCVHTITDFNSPDGQPILETVHKSTPPVGPNIEGAYVDEVTNDIILYGFRSKEFMVWNETTQNEIMTVDCGGSHRSWDYHISHDADMQQMFLCTQASALNLRKKVGESHRNIRRGGHGREIKTMAMSPSLYDFDGKKLQLLATGAEDTAIRLFIVYENTTPSPWGNFKCIRTLRGHETGLQQVKWSPCGQYLFSSGGREDFYVWRIRQVPAFGISAIREGEYPKTNPKSDLRIMGFDVKPIADSDNFLFCLAYSNSTVKVFSYAPGPTASFTLLAKGQYNTNCLTHINFAISESEISLVSSSTDGHVAIWDMPETLSRMFSVTDSELKQVPEFEAPSEPVPITWSARHSIHQSSVKAMETVQLPDGKLLVVSGGDDNALCISRADWQKSREQPDDESGEPSPPFSKTSIPQAHASAITAIAITCQQHTPAEKPTKSEFMLVTSGNDQRLKLWFVKVDLLKDDQEGVDVALLKDEYNAVADISCVHASTKDVSPGNTRALKRSENRIVLCGVGMDLWAIHA